MAADTTGVAAPYLTGEGKSGLQWAKHDGVCSYGGDAMWGTHLAGS
jgi:hypothetical protein